MVVLDLAAGPSWHFCPAIHGRRSTSPLSLSSAGRCGLPAILPVLRGAEPALAGHRHLAGAGGQEASVPGATLSHRGGGHAAGLQQMYCRWQQCGARRRPHALCGRREDGRGNQLWQWPGQVRRLAHQTCSPPCSWDKEQVHGSIDHPPVQLSLGLAAGHRLWADSEWLQEQDAEPASALDMQVGGICEAWA